MVKVLFFVLAAAFAALALLCGHDAALLVAKKLSPAESLGTGVVMSFLAGLSTFVGLQAAGVPKPDPIVTDPKRKNCVQ